MIRIEELFISGDPGGIRGQLRILGAKRRRILSASIPWNSGKLRPLGAIGDAKVLAIASLPHKKDSTSSRIPSTGDPGGIRKQLRSLGTK